MYPTIDSILNQFKQDILKKITNTQNYIIKGQNIRHIFIN